MERPQGPVHAPAAGRRGRSRFVTETIGCDPAPASAPAASAQETAFERARGISRVEIREGFAQVHVQNLPEPIEASRLAALEAVADAAVSIDFLKLTSGGMLFLIPGDLAKRTEEALSSRAGRITVYEGRSIVLVHAVNMRNEEGLIARIVSTGIASGAKIDHLGDMHDRLLIAAPVDDAMRLAEAIRSQMMENGA